MTDTNALTPEREAMIRRLPNDSLRSDVDIDDALEDLLAELSRVRAEVKATRAKTLNDAANDLVSACPEHGNADEAWMDCPCEYADDLRRMADASSTEDA